MTISDNQSFLLNKNSFDSYIDPSKLQESFGKAIVSLSSQTMELLGQPEALALVKQSLQSEGCLDHAKGLIQAKQLVLALSERLSNFIQENARSALVKDTDKLKSSLATLSISSDVLHALLQTANLGAAVVTVLDYKAPEIHRIATSCAIEIVEALLACQ